MVYFDLKKVLLSPCEEGLNDFISLKKDIPEIFKEADSSSVLNPKMNAWQSFFEIARDALDCFIEGELDPFDALVGENRCEVRALYFLILKKKYNRSSKFSTLIKEEFLKFKLINSASFIKLIATDSTFDIRVRKEVAFIIFCFALGVTKERGIDHIDRTNQNKLRAKYPMISSNLAKKLVNRFKEFIASESVAFIQRQSREISRDLENYAKYVQDPYVMIDKHLLKCVPNFFGMRVILDRLFSSSDNILAIKINFQKKSKLIQQKNLLFRCTSNKVESLSLEEQKHISPDTPIYVIEGSSIMNECVKEHIFISSIEKLIQSTDIYDVILPSFLHKTMYSGINKKKLLHIEDNNILLEILRLKSLPGRSIRDPSIFTISHILCLSKRELFLPPDVKSPNYLPEIEE